MKRKATVRVAMAVVAVIALATMVWLLRSSDVGTTVAPPLSAERHKPEDGALWVGASAVPSASAASPGAFAPAVAKAPANGSAPSVRKAQETENETAAASNPATPAVSAAQPVRSGLDYILENYTEVSRRDTDRTAGDHGVGILRKRILTAPDNANRHILLEETVLPGRNGGEEKVVKRTAMVADRVLVKLHPGASIKELQHLNAPYGAQVVEKPLAENLYLVKLQGLDVDAVRKSMAAYSQAAASVSYAQPDYVYSLSALPSDPMFSSLWGMHNTGQSGGTPDADIDAPEAWDIGTGSQNVIVGVIDTGVDYNHPDLADNIWTNPGEIPGNGIDDDNNGYIDDVHGYDFVNNDGDPMDDHFHGTHCSGTIGAIANNGIGVAGVCWNVRIMALKFLSSAGNGDSSAAIQAIEYARKMGAKLTSNSWGGGEPDPALKDAIDASGAAGMLFVVAAGNSGGDNDIIPTYPASYASSNIIAVAATDRKDHMAYFSCYGLTSVDIGAPGVDILSTFPTYMTDAMTSDKFSVNFGTISGTSMATPHVAGACALLLSLAPGATPAQIKAALLEEADPIPALAGNCVSGARMNVGRAMTLVGPLQMRVDNVAIGDAAGNADGIVNPGETAQLTFRLRGFGVGPIVGVHAALSTSDPMVTIVDGTSAFGDMSGYGVRQDALDPFAIAISPSCPTPREVTLNLNMTDAASHVWTASYKVRVFTSSRISGTVTRLAGGAPLAGATIRYTGPRSGSATTDVSGAYSILMANGTATLTASCPGYCSSAPVTVSVPPNASNVNFSLGSSVIAVTPASMNVTAVLGTSATRTLTITNTGNANLTWTLTHTSAALGATVRKITGSSAAGCNGLATDGRALWVGGGIGVETIQKLDAATGKLVGTLNVKSVVTNPYGMDWDTVNGWLWIATLDGSVKAVDPETGVLKKTISGSANTTCVAVGDGFVWVLDWSARTVTKRNAATGTQVGVWTVPDAIPGRVSGLEYYNGAIWVSCTHLGATGSRPPDGKVYKLNPANGSILGSFQADLPIDFPGEINICEIAVDEHSGLMWLLPFENMRGAVPMLVGLGEPTPWLKAVPATGTVAPGGSTTVVLALDSVIAGLGVQDATIEITSNDPTKPTVSVPVKFTVMTDASNRPPVITTAAWAVPAQVFSMFKYYDMQPATSTVHVVASDPDGDTLTYAWSAVSGYGAVNFTAPDAANTAVELSGRDGAHGWTGSVEDSNTNVLRVTVSDGKGGVATSDVRVTVDYGQPVIYADTNRTPGVTGLIVYMSENGSPTNFNLTLYASTADNSTLTWSVSTPALYGTATASGVGTSKAIGYTPPLNFTGWDGFIIQVTNGRNLTEQMQVYVGVVPVNQAPKAANDVYSTPPNTVLDVGVPGVLRNDTDADVTGK